MKKNEYTADDIQVLEWLEAVRKRPAMYVGSTRLNGFFTLIKLIFESFLINNHSDYFEITFKDKLEVIVRLHNLKNPINDTVNQYLNISSFEFPILNFLSVSYEFSLFDENNNCLLKQIYKKGLLTKGKVENKEFSADSIQIKFKLDNSIWDFENINYYFITDEIKDSAFLFRDKTFQINYLVNNKNCRIIYNFENGLLDQIEIEQYKGWGNFLFSTWEEKKINDLSLEIAFAFRAYQMDEPFLKSYVNYIYTHEGGTHVKGLLKGLTKALTTYCQQYKPNEVFEFSDENLRKHLVASIHIQIKQPLFHAPTKNRLVSPDVISPISDFVTELFLQKLESDTKTAEELIRRFKVWG